MTAAKQPVKRFTTTTGTAIRGTAKRIREAGVDLSKPVLWLGENIKAPKPVAEGIRYEMVVVKADGITGITAEGGRGYLGGVATCFWLQQVEEAPAEQAPAEQAPAAPEGDELDGLKFAELMVIAKQLKVPGRGVARIQALRDGIRAVRAAG